MATMQISTIAILLAYPDMQEDVLEIADIFKKQQQKWKTQPVLKMPL